MITLISTCCKASITLKPDDHFHHSEQEVQISHWYECNRCKNPCDVEEVENEKV